MSDKNNSGLEVVGYIHEARALRLLGGEGDVASLYRLRSEEDEVPLVRLSDAEAALAELVAVLERYSADGHLQSYEDRERFRKAARAALLKAEGAK